MSRVLRSSEAAPIHVWGWRACAAALLLALTVPRLWQRGMFLDGITYAVLARNMASGVGTFWTPSLSTTVYPQFYEQPSLGLALQAGAFWLLGDHAAVERIFSLAVLLVHALVIAGIWRRLLSADYDWLPVLFWVLPSIVTWGAVNNMLENTQALFTSAAVLALLRTCGPATVAATIVWSAAAGGAVIAAVLVKGPVGLFPLAVPLLLLILHREQRPAHLGLVGGAMYTAFGGIAAALLLFDPARQAIQGFFATHLAPTLTGARGGSGSRLGNLTNHLASGVWMRMGAFAGILWLFGRRAGRGRIGREAWFFLAVGCAASLPILVSPILAGHYLLPSVPFFALGFAALSLPAVATFKPVPGSRAWRAPVWLAGALVAAIAGVLVWHGPMEVRDAAMIRSLDRIAGVAPQGATIGTCMESAGDWGLVMYTQRFHRLSLDPTGEPSSGWFLATSGTCSAPPVCRLEIEAESFSLYRCAEDQP